MKNCRNCKLELNSKFDIFFFEVKYITQDEHTTYVEKSQGIETSCALSLRSTVPICTRTSGQSRIEVIYEAGTKKMSLLISRYLLDLNCWASRGEAQPLSSPPPEWTMLSKGTLFPAITFQSQRALFVSLRDNDRPPSPSHATYTHAPSAPYLAAIHDPDWRI